MVDVNPKNILLKVIVWGSMSKVFLPIFFICNVIQQCHDNIFLQTFLPLSNPSLGSFTSITLEKLYKRNLSLKKGQSLDATIAIAA